MKMEASIDQQVERKGRRKECPKSKFSDVRKSSRSLIIISLTIMFALAEIVTVAARPPRYRYNGQEDIGDYDDLDQGASAPYQNQEGDGGQNADSYGDNEPGKFGVKY